MRHEQKWSWWRGKTEFDVAGRCPGGDGHAGLPKTQQNLGGPRAAETDKKGQHHQPNYCRGIPLGRCSACNPHHKPREGTVFTLVMRKHRHSKPKHLVRGHRASWLQEWDLNPVSSSEVISKPRAYLGPQELPLQPSQRVWVCRASRSPKPGQS